MSVSIDLCTTIGCPPEQVWASIEDVETHTDWMADAVAITFRSEQRRGVGTEFECLTRIGPLSTTDVMTVTEWEPGAAMGIEHRGVVTGRGRFTLTPAGPGLTEFCWSETLRFPWWMGAAVGEHLSRPLLVRVWRGNLARLRRACERG
jgi:hypothetical protein